MGRPAAGRGRRPRALACGAADHPREAGRDRTHAASTGCRAAAAGRFVAVPLPNRLGPAMVECARLRDAGRLGRIGHAHFRLVNGPPERYRVDGVAWMLDPALSGGGALRNLGIHGVDCAAALATGALRVVLRASRAAGSPRGADRGPRPRQLRGRGGRALHRRGRLHLRLDATRRRLRVADRRGERHADRPRRRGDVATLDDGEGRSPRWPLTFATAPSCARRSTASPATVRRRSGSTTMSRAMALIDEAYRESRMTTGIGIIGAGALRRRPRRGDRAAARRARCRRLQRPARSRQRPSPPPMAAPPTATGARSSTTPPSRRW